MRVLFVVGAFLAGIAGAAYSGGAIMPRLSVPQQVCAPDGTCYRVTMRGQAAGDNPAAYVPQNDREQWAVDIAHTLGNDAPSPDVIAFIVAWTRAEDRSDDALSRYNPLNTTQDMPGASVVNSHGVKAYTSREQGLEATRITLGYNYAGYADIRDGIRTNDVQRAMAGLYASPWGTHAALVEQVYGEIRGWYQTMAYAPIAPQNGAHEATAVSTPLSLAGDCGYNVRVALDANGGALRRVVLQPGEAFSFNATMGNPSAIPYVTAAGVPGGCWCDLAARYSYVSRQIGLAPQFEHHGIQLNGVPWEDSVAIWNVGGQAGSAGAAQDLEIVNTLPYPVTFEALDDGNSVSIAVR